MLDSTPNSRVQGLLDKFEAAAAGDPEAASALFGPECFWRDLVAFTWNIKTMESRAIRCATCSTDCLARVMPRGIGGSPRGRARPKPMACWRHADRVRYRDRARIRPHPHQEPRLIWTLLTTMVRTEGSSRRRLASRARSARKHGVNPGAKSWKELPARRKRAASDIETQPNTLIIGGGQGGDRARRQIAATRTCRRSSSRRTRAPAIPGAIATSRSACTIPSGTTTCPIIDFPEDWPVFSPKDKIGDWLEMYAKVMELNYWDEDDRQTRAASIRSKQEWAVVVESRRRGR